ncbi:MAG: helix-turn-helix transcriptional regulator [Clostridia bacterium]|nr:helix-turn-helix transcriptional regulator [Clostridia bacterium]
MEKEQFIKRLVELRMNKGISARDMSLSIGQSAGYINNVENGVNFPSMTVFFYICEFLGVTPSEFFDLESKNPTKLDSIIKDLKCLDDKQLETIASLVKGLARK